MKHKLLLPLMAIVFAAASAFATPFFVQMGYYDADGTGIGAPVHTNITYPTGDSPECGASGDEVCKIDTFDAYVSPETATLKGEIGVLHYNP